MIQSAFDDIKRPSMSFSFEINQIDLFDFLNQFTCSCVVPGSRITFARIVARLKSHQSGTWHSMTYNM